jgi:hypothetical protein
MVPGVKVLALKVNLGVSKEVKMMTSFLGCFPNVEKLHIEVTPTPLVHTTLFATTINTRPIASSPA